MHLPSRVTYFVKTLLDRTWFYLKMSVGRNHSNMLMNILWPSCIQGLWLLITSSNVQRMRQYLKNSHLPSNCCSLIRNHKIDRIDRRSLNIKISWRQSCPESRVTYLGEKLLKVTLFIRKMIVGKNRIFRKNRNITSLKQLQLVGPVALFKNFLLKGSIILLTGTGCSRWRTMVSVN